MDYRYYYKVFYYLFLYVFEVFVVYTSALFWDAFAKLREATVSFVMSVCPSLRMDNVADVSAEGLAFVWSDVIGSTLNMETTCSNRTLVPTYEPVWCQNIDVFHMNTFIFHGSTALVGRGLLIFDALCSHSDTPHKIGVLWTRDQPDSDTSTWQNTHSRQTSMPSAEFEPAVPASDRPQTDALDHAATGTGLCE